VQLADIVEDLLTISRLQRGHVQPCLEPVEVGSLLREVAEDWRARAQAAEIRLELDVEPSLPAVETDSKQLKHVILELLENAFKYGEKQVMVRCNVAGDGLRISVEDDGPGLRPEERDHLFEPFFRGVDAYREQLPGTGLGLSIAKREADLMGASLSATNGPTGGAAFSLLLPLRAESKS
jgi:signal transduction histidine kinase